MSPRHLFHGDAAGTPSTSAPSPEPADGFRSAVDLANPPLAIALVRASFWFEESIRLVQCARNLPAVSRPQGMLLAQIAVGERRAGRIARNLGVSRQAVSSLINDLVDQGFITTQPDPEDARAHLLDFTPEHGAQSERLLQIFGELEDHIGRFIGLDRLSVLRHALAIDWGPPTSLDGLAPPP